MKSYAIFTALLITVPGNFVEGKERVMKVSASETAVGSSSASSFMQSSAGSAASREPSAEVNILLLKEQIRSMKEYQSDILSTVHWALGGVFTVALGLAVYGWFTNFKLYEKDRERLENDLESRHIAFKRGIDAQLSEHSLEVLKVVDGKIDSVSNRLASDVASLKGDSLRDVERLTSDTKKVADSIDKLETRFAEEQKMVRKQLWSAETDLRTVERYIWDIKNNIPNKLLTEVQGLEAALESGEEFRIEFLLEFIKDTLAEKVLPGDVVISKYVMDVLEKTLKVAERYRPELTKEASELAAKVKRKD